MALKNSGATHTVMRKSLADALMESGMHHFAAGGQEDGQVSTQVMPQQGAPAPAPAAAMPPQNMGTGNTGFDATNAQGDNFLNPTTSLDIPRNLNYISNNIKNPGAGLQNTANATGDLAGQMINGAGGIMKDAAAAFTTLNQYQAHAPSITNQSFLPQIANLQNQQASTYNQQQNLANALLMQSRGYGPNPAQAQLNQNTGTNMQNQAALMAGQRGASANPALMARQAAMQGANTQQNATGQAATLQANQQLGAQQALGQTYGQMANQSLQGESIQQGGQAAQNTAITTGQLGAQNINANISGQNAAALNGTAGGISNALGGGLANSLAKGGYVRKMSDGGIANYSAPTAAPISMTNWQNQGVLLDAPKKKDKKKEDEDGGEDTASAPSEVSGTAGGSSLGQMPSMFADGGDVEDSGGIGEVKGDDEDSGSSSPAPLMGIDAFGGTPAGPQMAGGNVTNGGVSAAQKGGGGGGGMMSGLMSLVALAQGGGVPFNTHLLAGGPVPGQAKVKGDSKKNDTEPTLLSPGEIVLPRSVTQAPDMEKKAIEFLRHIKKNKKAGYDDVQSARIAKKACGGKV